MNYPLLSRDGLLRGALSASREGISFDEYCQHCRLRSKQIRGEKHLNQRRDLPLF